MADTTFATAWLVGGAALIVLEVVLPGGISLFLGLGASLVAALLFLGVIEGPLQAFTVWIVGSLALLFGLRGFARKLLPSHVEKSNTSEDVDAYDQTVEVVETIPADGEGRISFRGTTWKAKSYGGGHALPKGSTARLIFRENLVWIVEPGEETSASTNDRGEAK